MAKNTIQKLTLDLGEAVLKYQDNVLRASREPAGVDEIWILLRQGQKPARQYEGLPGVGSMWTWTAMAPTRS